MACTGCYKKNVDGYCPDCRKVMFDGKKVSHILSFDAPRAANLPDYQRYTKSMSVSGAQLKYSLRLEDNKLVLTSASGEYLLKPIPPSTFIAVPDQAPANEHLTMQIARQVFGIETAANALIYFKDGTPAYITRRFDVKADGTKYLQEDMAQISERSRQIHGENFKYEGSYEIIGSLIRKYVGAYIPALEHYFKVVLFNYIFSNGDAHLKNFSLMRTDQGDYSLTPAYDLISTVLHTPMESDTALDLYKDDMNSDFYNEFGCYGRDNFEILAERLGLLPQRVEKLINGLLGSEDRVKEMVANSHLDATAKEKYLYNYVEKLSRFRFRKREI